MTENRQKYVEEVYEKLNKKLSAERESDSLYSGEWEVS